MPFSDEIGKQIDKGLRRAHRIAICQDRLRFLRSSFDFRGHGIGRTTINRQIAVHRHTLSRMKVSEVRGACDDGVILTADVHSRHRLCRQHGFPARLVPIVSEKTT